jgi:hypothetical protein
VAASIGRFDPDEWFAKHGPGAVADQRHIQFKYDFPNWPAKLEGVFPMSRFGFANYDCWIRSIESDVGQRLFLAVEPPSKLIAVPKTLKGPRLIASEPVAHQWCQQMIKDCLTSRLAATPISASIHFRDQTFNQNAAKEASHTQDRATIDLSHASDRLSCWVVERIFRRNSSLVEALHASRTRWVVNTIDRKSPQFHKLRKFACMGSACTFPVQSYVFAILAISAVMITRQVSRTTHNLRVASREVQVFGDDIVIPLDSWEVLQGLLGHLGLKVNQSKSFTTGRFRESCGLDAYDGHCVTPTYSMTYPEASRPESIASCVATHNNFILKGYDTVAQYVKSTVHSVKRFRFPNVPVGSGLLGWYDRFSTPNHHLRRRWNVALQRSEYLYDRVSTRTHRTPIETDSTTLQYFTEVTGPPLDNRERLGLMNRPAVSIRRGWEPIDV